MKILITGGFGYVGGRVGAYLASNMDEIYLGSRCLQPRPQWIPRGGVVQMDLNDKNSLLAACENMDVVVHAAGMNASECGLDPLMALEVNGAATGRLLQAAQEKAVSKFIYLSSAHVYSSNLSGVITEDTELTNTHPYATSNVAGEQATINHRSGSEMQTLVVRLANSFGSPMDAQVNCWMLVVNDLCRQAASDRRLVIRAQSNAVRNFVTMTDVCLAIEHLISNCQKFEPTIICNLGDRTKSLFDIAFAIAEIYESEKGVILPIKELSQASQRIGELDFRSLALQALDWHPTSNFRTELHELIKFCEVNFGCEDEV